MADLLQLLRDRHAKDILVDECMMGPGGSRRMDAWVLVPTWSPPTYIGYEIKVSRSDFLNDSKWPAYLPACHQFYWVCPYGLIKPEEVSEGAGLLWASKNGTKLYAKVKAPRREVDQVAVRKLMQHVLMCRTKIVPGVFSGRREAAEDRLAQSKKLLDQLSERKRIGASLAYKLSQRGREAVLENAKLREKIERWGQFRALLVAHGVDPEASRWQGEDQIRKAIGLVDKSIGLDLRRHAKRLEQAADAVDALRGKGAAGASSSLER